jgi:hypothetical protein
MTRNNDERTGAKSAPDAPSVVLNKQAAETFNFSVPTEFVDMPSKGKYYPKEHPFHNKESVEIKFMTAKEEDILTSRALLKKGIAIDRMLQSILMENVDVDSLLVGDKNALVVAARITGYGEN